MPYCKGTADIHGGGRRWFMAQGRGQPPAFCPECDETIARRNADWKPWQRDCVVCGASLHGRRLDRRTCTDTCRSQLQRVLKRIAA